MVSRKIVTAVSEAVAPNGGTTFLSVTVVVLVIAPREIITAFAGNGVVMVVA